MSLIQRSFSYTQRSHTQEAVWPGKARERRERVEEHVNEGGEGTAWPWNSLYYLPQWGKHSQEDTW